MQRPGYTQWGIFPSTLSVLDSNIQRRQQKDEIGEAWLLLPAAGFSFSFFNRRFLPSLSVAIVGRFHFIRCKPKKATDLPILDTSKGPFLPIFQSH
ncbi:hypothetical protein [Phaeodactylibacter xiamenensis]|uniref:hypothetical protein n=1 Tax=Phaeodactylibacter xiamenensis TaxID=1524460 RepID=UPI003CCC02C5